MATLRRLDWPEILADPSAWERLRREAPTETPFLTPDWLEAWSRHLGPAGPPVLLAVVEGAELRGLAPLHRTRIGATGLTALRPLGLGVSDYLDLLLSPAPEERRAGLGQVMEALETRLTAWDLLDLPNLPADSPTIDALTSLTGDRGLRSIVLPGYVCPSIALEGTWGDFSKSRPSKFRYNLRSRLRRLGELGDVRFRTATDAEDARGCLGELTHLHARRWQGQRTSTIFSSSARGRAFYAEVVGSYASRGLLDLTVLEVGGRLAAGSLGFVDRDTFYYYLPAWEPELSAYAPGSLLLAHLVQRAFEQGLRRFDFMLGDEPYKAVWATEERRTVRFLVANRGPRGRVALASTVGAHHVRDRARRSEFLRRVRRYGPGRALLGLHS